MQEYCVQPSPRALNCVRFGSVEPPPLLAHVPQKVLSLIITLISLSLSTYYPINLYQNPNKTESQTLRKHDLEIPRILQLLSHVSFPMTWRLLSHLKSVYSFFVSCLWNFLKETCLVCCFCFFKVVNVYNISKISETPKTPVSLIS